MDSFQTKEAITGPQFTCTEKKERADVSLLPSTTIVSYWLTRSIARYSKLLGLDRTTKKFVMLPWLLITKSFSLGDQKPPILYRCKWATWLKEMWSVTKQSIRVVLGLDKSQVMEITISLQVIVKVLFGTSKQWSLFSTKESDLWVCIVTAESAKESFKMACTWNGNLRFWRITNQILK